MAPFIAEDLVAKGIPRESVFGLPNAVRISEESADVGNNRVVLYVGNFSQGAHWKAFDILFQAWALVHRVSPTARLVVLGGGDRSVWEDYVRQSGCAESVEFVGQVSNPEHYYRNAAMLLLPSRVEGMSNALLEAQSWGLPCIVSYVPGNMAIVEDGVNGLVVPVSDANALAAAVGRLLSSAEDRARMGAAARERIVMSHSDPAVLDNLVKVYRTVIDARRVVANHDTPDAGRS
jgi:glycosyltransferase involved in cell wall biosynthesis